MPSLTIALTLEQCWHRVPGGTAVAALGMCRGLIQSDVNVVGVAGLHRGPPPQPWVPPVPVKQLPLPRPALYESWHRLRRPKVERVTGPVQVVHATSLAVPPRSAPLIVTIHDLAFLNEPAHFTKRGLSFFHRGLDLARREADLVVCPSSATLEDCARHGFERDRLRMIPMGTDPERATAAAFDEVRARLGLRAPYVLWTGTIEPRKNLPRLLQAFEGIDRRFELVLVGPRGWNEDLEPLIRPLGSRIKPLGFVPPGDLRALYAGAEVFCFPSLFEGFGLPVLEAMTQGTPVVTSRGTSTEELGGDAAVLVDPHDAGAIREGLRSILEDEVKAAELRRAGPPRALTYSWDRTAAALIGCYEEVSG